MTVDTHSAVFVLLILPLETERANELTNRHTTQLIRRDQAKQEGYQKPP